jgi:hypothetical protein
MGKSKEFFAKKRIKDLEITKAYAEYKIRHAGDLDADLANWVNDISRFIAVKKSKK